MLGKQHLIDGAICDIKIPHDKKRVSHLLSCWSLWEAILYQIGCFSTHCVKEGSNHCVKSYVADLYDYKLNYKSTLKRRI